MEKKKGQNTGAQQTPRENFLEFLKSRLGSLETLAKLGSCRMADNYAKGVA